MSGLLGRLEGFHDDGDGDPLVGHPPTGPLPSAEMGQREDHAFAALERAVEVLESGNDDAVLDLASTQRRQAERLDVVPGVRVERGP